MPANHLFDYLRVAHYFKVNTYADLPPAGENVDEIYIVLVTTGIWGINRKRAGLYYSNGVAWGKLGNIPPELVSGGVTTLHSHSGGGNGANIKSGSAVVPGKTWTGVTFTTAFASIPAVTGAISKNAAWSLRNITVNGFEIYLNTTGDNTFWWIATDVGNN